MDAGFIALGVMLSLLVGVAIGWFVGRRKTNSSGSQGILNVDCDDSESPNFFVAFTVPVQDVISRKTVMFEVNILRTNSQK